MNKACMICGADFAATSNHSFTCSAECRRQRVNATQRARYRARYLKPRECPWCAAMFEPGRNTQKFCKEQCRKDAENAAKRQYRLARDCRYCRAKFLPVHNQQRYCSPECLGRHIWATERKFSDYNRPLTGSGVPA